MKVRFNIATHRVTKEERATYVEILPDSFEESIEQRRHVRLLKAISEFELIPEMCLKCVVMFSNQGIVIEFTDDSGLIKCTQNPQLYFHMSEVIEKKRLELNEKVEFSVVPVSPPLPLYPQRRIHTGREILQKVRVLKHKKEVPQTFIKIKKNHKK